ncbi:hypothetical protein AST99_06065 [Formosa algae]|nr:hypothetical protein AST99_06065 [Formosa algae]
MLLPDNYFSSTIKLFFCLKRQIIFCNVRHDFCQFQNYFIALNLAYMKLLPSFVTTILVLLILFNSTIVSFTYAYYTLDRTTFIDVFCVNRDKPELLCNGKCQLKKVLETQDSEQNIPERIINFKDLYFNFNLLNHYNFCNYSIIESQDIMVYNNLYAFKPLQVCFHPPRL